MVLTNKAILQFEKQKEKTAAKNSAKNKTLPPAQAVCLLPVRHVRIKVQ